MYWSGSAVWLLGLGGRSARQSVDLKRVPSIDWLLSYKGMGAQNASLFSSLPRPPLFVNTIGPPPALKNK